MTQQVLVTSVRSTPPGRACCGWVSSVQQGIGSCRDGAPGLGDQARAGNAAFVLADICLTKVLNRQMAFTRERAEPPPSPCLQSSSLGLDGARPPATLCTPTTQSVGPHSRPRWLSPTRREPGLEVGALTCFYHSCLQQPLWLPPSHGRQDPHGAVGSGARASGQQNRMLCHFPLFIADSRICFLSLEKKKKTSAADVERQM